MKHTLFDTSEALSLGTPEEVWSSKKTKTTYIICNAQIKPPSKNKHVNKCILSEKTC